MQLRDLSIENRRYAISMKADMTADNRLEVLLNNDYLTNIKGIHSLLVTEPFFFLINEDFLETTLKVAEIYNDKFALKRLEELKRILLTDPKKCEDKVREFINCEKLKRGCCCSYDDYMGMLELDDLLLKETNYNYLLENPYILYSISYLKNEFSDYYDANYLKDNYLYTILKLLTLDSDITFEDLIAINETISLFPKCQDEKIITFAKRI